MDEHQIRKEWDIQRGEENKPALSIKFRDIVGFTLIVIGVSFSIWILLVIMDLLNGEELGLMKAISREIISYKDKTNDINLELPGKSVGIVFAGCLLFIAAMISMCFINQGVVVMHADLLKIVRKIDALKETIVKRFGVK